VQSPEPRWHNRYACSRRRRTRGRRRDTNGSRVLVRPAGTGTRPPTARSYCCPHAPTVINERPPFPPHPQKHFAPPGALRRQGDWTIPSDGAGDYGRIRSPCLRNLMSLSSRSNVGWAATNGRMPTRVARRAQCARR